MAKQPAKKTTTKKTVAKKAAEKTMKKTVATKKATAKKATAPVIETYSCGCSHSCQCGGKCHKGGFLKKLLFFVIVFALGFATAQMTCCNKRGGKMGPRPQFENGCLVAKCPKMAQFAQKMDTNQDGCISKDEFRTAKKQFKAELRMYELNMQAQELAAQQAALLHKQQQQLAAQQAAANAAAASDNQH